MATKADAIAAKKRARQKKKREAARETRASRPGTQGPTKVRLDAVAGWPLWECYLSENWSEQGATVQALITRKSGQGAIALATVQFDLAMRGIVDCKLLGGLRVEDFNRSLAALTARGEGVVMREPELVVKVVRQAADYGKQMGFVPPEDWDRIDRFIGEIDTSAVAEDAPTGIPGAPDVKPSMFANLRKRIFGG